MYSQSYRGKIYNNVYSRLNSESLDLNFKKNPFTEKNKKKFQSVDM